MSNKTREEGYYWCKCLDTWIVCEYNPVQKKWWGPGVYYPKQDRDFTEIDETPITRNEHGQAES